MTGNFRKRIVEYVRNLVFDRGETGQMRDDSADDDRKGDDSADDDRKGDDSAEDDRKGDDSADHDPPDDDRSDDGGTVVAHDTDVGCERDLNEDTVRHRELPEGHLLVVADGMGGHAAGDVASETAADAFVEAVAEARPDAARHDAILPAVETAHEAVSERAVEPDGDENMGTTLVAALVTDGEATVVNVGDSRAYLVGETVEQITVDHNLARELVEQGTIDESELDDHPHRHVLSQSLGGDGDVDPDRFEVSLDGRTLLLCSDGLPEEVDEETIRETVTRAETPESAVDALISRANERGGSDNVSVALAVNDDERRVH